MEKHGHQMQSRLIPNLTGLVCVSLALVVFFHYSAHTLPEILPWLSPSCEQGNSKGAAKAVLGTFFKIRRVLSSNRYLKYKH